MAAIWYALGALPAVDAASQSNPDKPAEALYLQLGQVGLDPARVYKVRDAALERSAVHITLEDGTIGFTQDVMGRITGAFFEGDGEILLTPPNDVERRSMSLFTGMAILEERFQTAYFRFNDDTAVELQPDLWEADDKKEFVELWDKTARNLAQTDAMRLLLTFSRMLPVNGHAALVSPSSREDGFLHARLQGSQLGVFDVYFDSLAGEQVEAGQVRRDGKGETYYDVWTSFTPSGSSTPAVHGTDKEEGWRRWESPYSIRSFTIKTEVQPPQQIRARARLRLDINDDQIRILLFELSRFLQVESVTLNGEPVDFIHNPAVEGTQRARQGNDVVAVVSPEPLRAGQKVEIEFAYAGEVLAEAGSGLLYVGERGTWYPNRGLAMADFDLEFSYPQGWTLVATGKPVPASEAEPAARAKGLEMSHWVSERPIPVAGFNLGKYKIAKTQAGDVVVETYATQGVERDFPNTTTEDIDRTPNPAEITPQSEIPRLRPVIVPGHPSPARNEVTVAESAARAIRYYSERFGPYPYSRLALTQIPGKESQGWPSLVFLSSYAFLNQQEREQLHFEPYRTWLQQSIPAHETAHQWWGDLVSWKTYRDQWFSEGLANYCALMMVQEKSPENFREIMEHYRRDLVQKNKDGMAPKDAGPVTLGARLLSSRFPEGYEAISYGRATWLFHMLRTMLKDGAVQAAGGKGTSAEEPFIHSLRKLRQKYGGKSISTREMLDVFAEDLPPSLRYEGKSSLDWFLQGWINGTSLPKLELKGVKLTPKEAGIVVSGTILQNDAPENLVTSVPVYGVVAGRPVLLGRVFADGEETSFHVAAPAGIHKITLDPNATVLTSPK